MSLTFHFLLKNINIKLLPSKRFIESRSFFREVSMLVISIFLLLSAKTQIQAQTPSFSNLRQVWLTNFDSLNIQFDTLPIVGNSILVRNKKAKKIAANRYKVDAIAAKIQFLKKPTEDSIELVYRVFPSFLAQTKSRKPLAIFEQSKQINLGQYKYEVKSETLNIFDLGSDLNYNGNFSRGISVGSNQDLVLNSAFNLQMQGQIGNGIEVKAAISDNNIPFQAQGNTQQLQEFDRIYIQLTKDRHQLIVGDYELKRPDAYFMNFFKRLQGFSFSTVNKLGNGDLAVKAAAAVARGQYNRQIFQGQEGNQGPYKLLGANGESFIIILSGSERVFIDGTPLVRGFDNDYTIDYNLGEIIFTPNRLITKDVRIVIEFEYSVQNYLRSLVYAETAFEQNNTRVYANLYSEQDAKNQPLLQDLDGEQKQFLRDLGDNSAAAFYSRLDSIGFEENRVLYAKKDTILVNQTIEYYEFSQNPEVAIYSLSFSNVGAGKGNYLFSEAGINGRVFEWSPPDENGNPTGDFEPVILLITPQKKQLLTLGFSQKMKNSSSFLAEVAISNRDENSFSEIDDADDTGVATKLKWQQNIALKKDAKWQLQTSADYEFVQERFEFLEDYRAIEFGRDWNVSNTRGQFDEHLGGAAVAFKHAKSGGVRYDFQTLIQQNEYSGFRHILENDWRIKGLKAFVKIDYLQGARSDETNRFFRPRLRLNYSLPTKKAWQVGFEGFQEKNQIRAVTADSLTAQSFNFSEITSFIKSPEKAQNKYLLQWTQRWDFLPEGNKFALNNRGNIVKFSGAMLKNPKNQLTWNATYRHLFQLETKEVQQTVLGEINYFFEAFRGLIRSNSNYQLGSGQTQIIEYEYTAVTNGLGTHAWDDLNDDGFRQINEFRLIYENEFADTTFIQIALPTNQYTPTNIVGFSQSLNIIPKRIWFNKKGVRSWLANFEWQSLVDFSRAFPLDSVVTNPASLYNPLAFRLPDEVAQSVVSERIAHRHSFFFNRGGTPLNAEAFFNFNQNKSLLVNGTILSGRENVGAKARWSFNRAFSANLETEQINNRYIAEADSTNNFDLTSWRIEPNLKWQKNTKWGIEASYKWLNHKNIGGENGQEQRISARFRYNQAQKNAFETKFSLVQLSYSSTQDQNIKLENEILQTLKVGFNYVWNVSFRTRISKSVELRLNYDGRKSENSRLQNTGRIELSAIF